MVKAKTLPDNFNNLSIDELEELLDNFNKTCTKLIQQIKDRIIFLMKQEQSVLQAMLDLMPEPDYFKQKVNKNKEEEIKRRLANLTEKQVNAIIDNTTVYENDFQALFFQKYADQIIKRNPNTYIKITYIDEENKIKIKFYKVESGLIKRILDFYADEAYLLKQDGSDKQDEYIIAYAVRAEIIKNVDEKEEQKIQEQIQLQKDYNRAKRKGAYFNFLNKTVLDLSRYQIGKTYDEHLKLSKTNCFMHCVKECGKYTKDQVNHIISQLNAEIFQFSTKNLKNIDGLGFLQITVYEESGRTNYVKYNAIKDQTPDVFFGLYKEHFFIEEELPVTTYWIEHYNEFKEIPGYLEQPNTSQVRGNSLRKSEATIKTGQVLRNIMKSNLFEEIKELNRFNFQQQSKQYVQAPENAEQFCNEEDYKEKQEKDFQSIFFADFETFTVDANNISQIHDPFLIVFNYFDPQTNQLSESKNGRNIFSLMNFIEKQCVYPAQAEDKTIPNFLVYFHNLSYDASFIIKEQLKIQNFIMVDGSILQFNTIYKNRCNVIFRDSNRIFSDKLTNLPKMFLSKEEQQTIYKEIFPYTYYNKQNYIRNVGNIDEAFKSVHGETKEDFITSLDKAGALTSAETFDLQKYALYYCKQDVNVLSKCVIKFRQMLKDEFNLELFNFISISSLSLEYQKKKECFDKCTKVSGLLRQYFQQFIVGGRVMVKENKKALLKNVKISDFDAVSLYPSAQKRLYYPSGKCYTLTDEEIEHYNNPKNLFKITEARESADQNTLYLQVKIMQGPCDKFVQRSFPLLSSKNEDGIRIFSNDVIQKCYYVNHIDLQDLITFQGFEYQILSGVKFSERHYKIQEVISEMFEQRVKYKKEKNPCQAIYKLMLNSSYGKTCEGMHNIAYQILGENQFNKYIFDNYNTINDIEKIGEKYFVKENVETNNEKAYTYIGSLILSMSKRIMNEVMCLAEDNGIDVYITDTDSMHVQTDDIPRLGQLFQEKYGRQLIGEKQGQFHSDFDSPKGEVLYADSCVFLGKKFYIDRLLLKDSQHDYHVRGKGLSKKCILYKAKQMGLTVLELYEKLFEGAEIEFDLCADNAVKFEKAEFSYITKSEFKRKVSFK